MGTVINAGAILLGGLFGLLTGGRLPERFRRILNTAMALSILAMSLGGIVSGMLTVTEGRVTSGGTYLIIFSLVLGGIVGELLDIDRATERFGAWLKRKTGNAKDAAFVDGFVNASLTVSIGAMAVVGALMDGMNGDYSILLTKAVLDFVIILVMTASMGKGCIFSAIPVAVLQGSVTLLSKLLTPIMTPEAIDALSLVGSVLILCVGINLLAEGKIRIKVANLLPAVVFAAAGAFVPFL